MSGITASRVLNFLTQAHRFVIIHHSVTFYWAKSFLGYIVLLLRAADFQFLPAIEQLQRSQIVVCDTQQPWF